MRRDLDFETSSVCEARNDAELQGLLLQEEAIRLAGSGSAQHLLPAPGEPVVVASLARMNKILRFEADDLTCTVEAGVTHAQLQDELSKHRLVLPCAGGGTIGGMFAADRHGPVGPAAHAPRSLLLGFEGMLAEGLAFKAGARVVKSVAGFDLNKLFVGSRGQMFCVTRLHLKLRPEPHYQEHFSRTDLEPSDGLELFHRLRLSGTPPTCLTLRFGEHGAALHGTLAGSQELVKPILTAHGLQPASPPEVELEPSPDTEILQASLMPGRLKELLPELVDRESLVLGGGRLQIRSASVNDSDKLLAKLSQKDAFAWVQSGSATRRGTSNSNHNTRPLAKGLKDALDPKGILR